MSTYNESLNQQGSIGSRSNTIYQLNGRRKKINPLVSDDEDDAAGDDLKDLEFEESRLETPKSFRHDNSTRYSTRRTTVKIPLKSGEEESNRITTPAVMERLTKYRSRQGTPLRSSSRRKSSIVNTYGKSDPIKRSPPDRTNEDPNIIDREREDTLIKQRKLISDDNKFSPNDHSVKFFKSSNYPQGDSRIIDNNSSPTRINSRSLNDMESQIRSPPSNLRIRPFQFDKLNQDKEAGKNRRLFFDDQELKRTIPSAIPSQASINGNVDEMPEDKTTNSVRGEKSKNDIEFDSSDDENSEKASTKPQINGDTNKYASPNVNINMETSAQTQTAPQVEPRPPSVPPQNYRPAPPSMGHRFENTDHINTQQPANIAHDLNNIASSVEDSVSTNGIGLDKGSLNVGIPSRLDMDPQNDMQRLETLERINVTMEPNGTARLSFLENNNRNGPTNIGAVDDIAKEMKANKSGPEVDAINKMNNAMDLESDISSDDNPVELLNELNSFLPNKSSPAKKSDRSPVSRTNFSRTGDRFNTDGGPSRTETRYSGATSKSAKHRNIPVPEMTPIRKHYSRLSDKYAKHIMNKRREDHNGASASSKKPPPTSYPISTEPESEDSSNDSNRPWTADKWYKLNKLITSDHLNVDDIINSDVLVSHLGCQDKNDLKERVGFLLKYNEFKKLEKRTRRRRLL